MIYMISDRNERPLRSFQVMDTSMANTWSMQSQML